VADQQHPAIGRRPGHLRERLRRVKGAGKRPMHGQQLALLRRPTLNCQFRRALRTHLRAAQNRMEIDPQALESDARRTRLALAPLGQAALGVLARAMRLGVCVPQ